MFKKTSLPEIDEKMREAEQLKQQILVPALEARKEVARLNKLIKSNGFGLKIVIGMGHHD